MFPKFLETDVDFYSVDVAFFLMANQHCQSSKNKMFLVLYNAYESCYMHDFILVVETVFVMIPLFYCLV